MHLCTSGSYFNDITDAVEIDRVAIEIIIRACWIAGAVNAVLYSELVYAFVSERGYASTVVRVDKPAGLNITGEMRLQQKEKVPLDESTIVWGLQGTDKQQMLSYSSIAETLQSAQ